MSENNSQPEQKSNNHLRPQPAFLVLLSLVILLALILPAPGKKSEAAGLQNPTEIKQSSEQLWQDADEVFIVSREQRQIVAQAYRRVRLNKVALDRLLRAAPMEFTPEARDNPSVMTLPLPDGGMERFFIQESPIMDAELAAQFPEINTYSGQGIDDPTATLRFDLTPAGFHAQVLRAEGSFYIDPYAKDDTTNYISYFKRDFWKEGEPFRCYVVEDSSSTDDERSTARRRGFMPMVSSGTTLRNYRLALAATGEYTAFQGGTQALALAAMTTSMNRVNGIFEREVSIRMVMIAGELSIIYTNSATDPYTNGAAGTMMGENQSNLDTVIGSANYDIGHVFGTNSGGVVNGSVCTAGTKARGVTGSGAPVGDPFDVDYVAHEMGHQFTASHTFNDGTNGSCADAGQRIGAAAYEPGSASTIMGYAGICGSADLQPHSDPYFHIKSIEQIVAYTTGGGGSSCAMTIATGNNPPSVSAGSNYTIPQRTPFKLTASGSDPDGDPLTFCWEEYDLGSASPPEGDDGSRPILRSYSPISSVSRTFPSLPYILNNANMPPTTYLIGMNSFLTGEVLPSTNRTMSFQVTARDNRAGGGGVNSSAMQMTVTTSAGPFDVTSPNTAIVWTVGSSQTVTWNVAGTTAAPVSCANVNILLSTDGGNTFPITLAPGTPNDGTQSITVPANSTTTARVKVESVGNIFFDISNTNFTVNAPPVITCSPNLTVSNDSGSCSAVVSFATDASDDLSVVIGVCVPPSLSTFPKGTTTVTCTATDPQGATDTCNFTITVNDTEPPSITCPANITQSTDPGVCTAVVTYATPMVSDNCPGVDSPSCIPVSGATFAKGTTTVNCSVSDSSGNSSMCSFTVTVNDTEPPAITCPASITTVSSTTVCITPAGTTVSYPPPVATDNCPGVVAACVPPSGSPFPIGATTVTCTATDTSGNSTTCSFSVAVYDVCLQDDTRPSTVLLWNSQTGDYLLCYGGSSYTGRGRSTVMGCVYVIEHESLSRRIMARVDKTLFRGSGSVQIPPGKILCTLIDRNTKTNTCACAP